jgi:hypothetical protein
MPEGHKQSEEESDHSPTSHDHASQPLHDTQAPHPKPLRQRVPKTRTPQSETPQPSMRNPQRRTRQVHAPTHLRMLRVRDLDCAQCETAQSGNVGGSSGKSWQVESLVEIGTDHGWEVFNACGKKRWRTTGRIEKLNRGILHKIL